MINWDNGDATITQAGNVVTLAGATLTATLTNSLSNTANGGIVMTSYDGSAAVADIALDIDGMTDIGAAIADEDLFIIDDGANGTNRSCLASRLKTYVGSSVLTVDTVHTVDGEVLGSDVNLYSQAATRTLDLPSAAVAGDVIYIKNNASAHVLTVATEGSETIDGSATKILYHQYESLTVICDGTNWHIV